MRAAPRLCPAGVRDAWSAGWSRTGGSSALVVLRTQVRHRRISSTTFERTFKDAERLVSQSLFMPGVWRSRISRAVSYCTQRRKARHARAHPRATISVRQRRLSDNAFGRLVTIRRWRTWPSTSTRNSNPATSSRCQQVAVLRSLVSDHRCSSSGSTPASDEEMGNGAEMGRMRSTGGSAVFN